MFAALSEALSEEAMGLASNINGLPTYIPEPRATYGPRSERAVPRMNFETQEGPAVPASAAAAARDITPESMVDPLKLLLDKETYVRAAKQAASYAGVKKQELVAAAADAAERAVEAAKAAAAAVANPPRLPEVETPLPLSRRGPAPSALLRAAWAGNNYKSTDVMALALGTAGGGSGPVEESIKPEANFAYTSQRFTESMRSATMNRAEPIKVSLSGPVKQPIPQQVLDGTDPILQATLPDRKLRHEGLEDYNFCADIPASTPAHKVPTRCVKEAFKENGVGGGGSAEVYENLYILPTWADMKIYIAKLAADVKALDKGIQERARVELLGSGVVAGTAGAAGAAGVPGVEVFARVGNNRVFVGRKVVDRLPLSMGDFVNYAGAADFLAVCRLHPDRPQKLRWRMHSPTGMILVVDKELWDFEVEKRDESKDFRRLGVGGAVESSAETLIHPFKDSFVRALWSTAPEGAGVEVADGEGAPFKTLAGFLTQDPRAPMLRFAVYGRERPAPPAGTYANPQFVGTFGSGRRFEESRNPDIFYSLLNGVEVDTRRLAGFGLDSTAAFYSRSFWQCTTPVSPIAWRSITMTIRFEQLPTAGQDPMRCVATAFPFFIYVAYTPAGKGFKQGVYFYLYRLKDSSYVFCDKVPVEKSRWYHLALTFKDGMPGDLTLKVKGLGGGGEQTDGGAVLKVGDDVFYRPLPPEGTPMISLGFHKYGGGIPGFTGSVGYFHVFDYMLGDEEYRRDLENRWDIKWHN